MAVGTWNTMVVLDEVETTLRAIREADRVGQWVLLDTIDAGVRIYITDTCAHNFAWQLHDYLCIVGTATSRFDVFVTRACCGLARNKLKSDSVFVELARMMTTARRRLSEASQCNGCALQQRVAAATANIEEILSNIPFTGYDPVSGYYIQKLFEECDPSVIETAVVALGAVDTELGQIDALLGVVTTGAPIAERLAQVARPFVISTGRAPFTEGPGLYLHRIPTTLSRTAIARKKASVFDALVITADRQFDFGMVVRGSPSLIGDTTTEPIYTSSIASPVSLIDFADSRFPTTFGMRQLHSAVIECLRTPPYRAIAIEHAVRQAYVNDTKENSNRSTINTFYRDVAECLDNYQKCSIAIVARKTGPADQFDDVRKLVAAADCKFAIVSTKIGRAKYRGHYVCMINAPIPASAAHLVVADITLDSPRPCFHRSTQKYYGKILCNMLPSVQALLSPIMAWSCITARWSARRSFYTFLLVLKSFADDCERPTKRAATGTLAPTLVTVHEAAVYHSSGKDEDESGASADASDNGRSRARRARSDCSAVLPELPLEILQYIFYGGSTQGARTPAHLPYAADIYYGAMLGHGRKASAGRGYSADALASIPSWAKEYLRAVDTVRSDNWGVIHGGVS